MNAPDEIRTVPPTFNEMIDILSGQFDGPVFETRSKVDNRLRIYAGDQLAWEGDGDAN